ncbi:hypothetical protein TSUD_01740 [Trifolium subterraneum]|nr:hypothetical protein TSUD_01740 [Trifolium subterraneum]
MENEGNTDGSENPVAIAGSGIDTDGGESQQIGSEIDTNGGESEEKQIGSEIDTNYGGESQQIGEVKSIPTPVKVRKNRSEVKSTAVNVRKKRP